MTYRRLAAALGLVALGVGLVAIWSPGLAVGLDRVIVTAIGVVALVQAGRVVQARRAAEGEEATTPDPELVATPPPPGDDLETALEQFLDARHIYFHRSRIRDALRSAATAVLTQYAAFSPADIPEVLRTGAWTDDRYAAAFLAGDAAPMPPLRTQLRELVRGESAFHRGVRHTVDAIAAVAGIHRDGSGSVPVARLRPGRYRPSGAESKSTRFTTATGDDGEPPVEDAAGVVAREAHATGHWHGVSVIALVGIGVGVLVEQPAVVLAGVVGIGYAAYARSAALPADPVAIERTLSDDRPAPGDDVEVTVTLTNEGDRWLPDLRVVDGVPEALAVASGSPRLGTALRPGGRTTFSYTVEARRGVHTFGPALLVARDITNTLERERWLPAATTLRCIPALRPAAVAVPLRDRVARHAGRVETASGGAGLEFFATRAYRPGDDLRRIDWNRRARTGELTTVEFRRERTATVVLVIDARPTAYAAPDPQSPHAVDRAVEAAGGLFARQLDSGDQVGIAAAASTDCWLAPGAGPDHRLEARELLATHPALTPVPKRGPSAIARWGDRLANRLAPGSQVVFLSPLVDDHASRFARRLDERGYPVTAVSPDPTADRTTGHLLARVGRTIRLSALRAAAIPVVDWPPGEPIDVALARHAERWSR